MFRKIFPVFAAVIFPVLFILGLTGASGKCKGGAPAFKKGTVLIKYKNPALAAEGRFSAAEARLALRTRRTFPVLGIKELKLPPGIRVKDALAALRQDPGIAFAEPDYAARIQTAPNDPLYGSQWALPAINAPSAWSYVQGNSAVVLAVLDTGVDYTHQDITANIWANPNPATPAAGGSYSITGDVHGWDFVNNGPQPFDDNGHGTHVSGIAGADGNDNLGIAGTNWQAGIMPVKVLDASGAGYLDTILQGIQYAAARGASIVNCSFAFPPGIPFPASLQSAIALYPDMLFVFAAGNDGANTDNYNYPVLPNLLFVASVGQAGNLSAFSNYGPSTVGLAAPGEQILSLKAGRRAVYLDNFDNPDWTDPTGLWTVSNSSLADAPQSGSDSYAQSPPIDLTGQSACIAGFNLGLIASGGDSLYAEASKDGANWTTLGQFRGAVPNPSDTGAELVSLDQFTGAPVYFRFRLQTSAPGESAVIHNFNVTCTAPGTGYLYESGTSMSTAFVAGAAALIKSEFPSVSAAGLKTLILGGVDKSPSLSGKVSSGGSLDVYKSLLPPAPANFAASSVGASSVTLAWTPDPNASVYVLSRSSPGGSFQAIADLSGSAYTDSGLSQDTTYQYSISAQNKVGASPQPTQITVTTDSPSSPSSGGHGCFIATAAFGSPMAKDVLLLDHFRDRYLLANWAGRKFVTLYYRYSPPAAGFIARHERLRTVVRWMLYPIVCAARYPAMIMALMLTALAYVVIKIVKYTTCKLKKRFYYMPIESRKGFTLLEVLVVLVILGGLAAIVAPKIIGHIEESKVTDAKIQIRNLETGLKSYYLDNGFYPSTDQGLQALVEPPTTGRIPQHFRKGGYLEQNRVPKDPWGNPYVYASPGQHGDYDLLSLGPDGGQNDGQGDDKSIKSWDLGQH